MSNGGINSIENTEILEVIKIKKYLETTEEADFLCGNLKIGINYTDTIVRKRFDYARIIKQKNRFWLFN